MENINILEIEYSFGNKAIHAIIDHGNEQFTSMPKSVYDEQQAALSTPSLPE